MHLILDVDDVILGWITHFELWCRHTKDLDLDPAGPQTWDLTEWAGPNAYDLMVEFNNSPWFAKMTFLPGTMEFMVSVARLAEGRPRIDIVTACGDAHPIIHARLASLRSIDDLITTYHFLPLGSSKCEVLRHYPAGSVLVEDNYRHACDAVDLGHRAFVFRRGHNRQIEAKAPISERNLMWIDTWGPVLDYLSRNTGESHETFSGVRFG